MSATAERPGASSRTRPVGAAIAALAALGVSTFSFLRPTNFRGYDEWLIFWMLSRRLISFPYANRPFGLVWHVPAWMLAPDRLWGFQLVHAFWLTVVGVLAFLIVRRLLPGHPDLAFLGGALAIAWMPSEETRIATVQMIQYSGCTAGALLATWLLLEAGHRRSRVLLLAAATVATITALSFEATLPVLGMGAGLLLLGSTRAEARRRLPWAAGWLVLTAALGLRAILPVVTHLESLGYQLGGSSSLRPARGVLRHTGIQLRYHLHPLTDFRVAELAEPAVWLAVVLFVAGLVVATRGQREEPRGAPARGAIALAGLLGLGHAVLAYLPFLLTRGVRGPVRTEFLSAAGIGVLIAAVVVLVASLAPPRARLVVVATLGAWVVAGGTGRTIAMQREWDASLYANQRSTLQQIGAMAPGLQPHTLVILMQSGHTWFYSFTFSKAVEYLYADAARGWAPGADPFLLEARLEPDAVWWEPDIATRRPWRQDVERYRHEEVVVFGEDDAGRVRMLDTWPADLGPLPPGARYAPRSRIRAEGPAPTQLAIVSAPR
ncbi:MAG: hypothetical protein LJF30_16995 [Acidobacteria bacterium]|nr:hypothetical protein [Acidobacteriota bacterium]